VPVRGKDGARLSERPRLCCAPSHPGDRILGFFSFFPRASKLCTARFASARVAAGMWLATKEGLRGTSPIAQHEEELYIFARIGKILICLYRSTLAIVLPPLPVPWNRFATRYTKGFRPVRLSMVHCFDLRRSSWGVPSRSRLPAWDFSAGQRFIGGFAERNDQTRQPALAA